MIDETTTISHSDQRGVIFRWSATDFENHEWGWSVDVPWALVILIIRIENVIKRHGKQVDRTQHTLLDV